MRERINKAFSLLWEMLKLFFGNKEKIDHCKKTTFLAVCYRSWQYAMLGVTVGFVGMLRKYFGATFEKHLGTEYLGVFLILFSINVVLMGIVVFLNSKTTHDFTFMESLRSLSEKAYGLFFLFGFLFEGLAFLILLIWSGADQFVIYFEKRITSLGSKVVILVLASCASMAIWTYVYLGIVDGAMALFHLLYT